DQAAQANQVDALGAGGLQDLLTRHHHAEIEDLVIVTAQYHADDVLADVVDVALDGRHQDLATRLPLTGGMTLPARRLHERHQVGDCFLHHAGALDHLWQEHLASAEQVADDVHAVHQRSLDNVERSRVFLP